MARTPSTMLPLGTPAPDFSLTDVLTNAPIQRGDFEGRPLLVMFICNHCPYVVRVRDGMVAMANEYVDRGVAVVAINSNDLAGYPQDGPGPMKELAAREGWRFPFCFDETQEVARAYRAACTPDFFLFDAAHELAYRGQMDAARPGNDLPADGADLRRAMDAVLEGGAVEGEQRPSLGCGIKWKPGNEPKHFG